MPITDNMKIDEVLTTELEFYNTLKDLSAAISYLLMSEEARKAVTLSPEAHALCNDIQAVYLNDKLPADIKVRMLDELIVLNDGIKYYLTINNEFNKKLETPEGRREITSKEFQQYALINQERISALYELQRKANLLFSPLKKNHVIEVANKLQSALTSVARRLGKYALFSEEMNAWLKAYDTKSGFFKTPSGTEKRLLTKDEKAELEMMKISLGSEETGIGYIVKWHEDEVKQETKLQKEEENKKEEYAKKFPVRSRVEGFVKRIRDRYTEIMDRRREKQEIRLLAQRQVEAGTSNNFSIPVPILEERPLNAPRPEKPPDKPAANTQQVLPRTGVTPQPEQTPLPPTPPPQEPVVPKPHQTTSSPKPPVPTAPAEQVQPIKATASTTAQPPAPSATPQVQQPANNPATNNGVYPPARRSGYGFTPHRSSQGIKGQPNKVQERVQALEAKLAAQQQTKEGETIKPDTPESYANRNKKPH